LQDFWSSWQSEWHSRDLFDALVRSQGMFKRFLTILVCWVFTVMTAAASSLHDFSITGIDGKPMPLAQFKGSAVLLVNTASECGFTGQYDGLEKLWESYKGKGLVIVGVPSNDFGGQEPGKAEEIATFCKMNYGVTFPLADKAVVKGKNAIPVYVWAGQQAGVLGSPKWNFHKYLFGREGQLIDWFSSPTEPMSKKLTAAVEKALAQ
jgi:glutathione peroxidase